MNGRTTTARDVAAVLEMLERGCTYADITAEVGVSQNTISKIKDGWRGPKGKVPVKLTKSTSRDWYLPRGS